MNTDELRGAVRRALHSVAPEADLDALAGGADLRDALDIDSMDFLRFVQALHRDLGVEVPEAAYPKLSTLDACVAWLGANAAARR